MRLRIANATETISGFYQEFAGIFMVYRLFSATAEIYTLMSIPCPVVQE
jgi:hypothetical protein